MPPEKPQFPPLPRPSQSLLALLKTEATVTFSDGYYLAGEEGGYIAAGVTEGSFASAVHIKYGLSVTVA